MNNFLVQNYRIMSEQIQPTEQDKAPQIKAELEDSDITMKISKAPKQKKQTTDKKDIPYLDDHIQSYGNNLMSSIANLIEQSKQECPKRRAKKQMTPEMIERCRANLAKGRATIARNRQAKGNKVVNNPIVEQPIKEPIQQPIQQPVQQPIQQPIQLPKPIVQKPIIEQPKPIIQQVEKVKWKYGARLF